MTASQKLSFYFHEISGSLGDLPLFFIFSVGLSQLVGLNFLSILFWSGVTHLVMGFIFKIPLPFQPMKAMGMMAMTQGLTQLELLSAGILTGLILLGTNVLGWFQKLYDIFPKIFIRAIQLWLAFQMLKKAYQLILSDGSFSNLPFLGLFILLGVGLLVFKKQHVWMLLLFGMGFLFLLKIGKIQVPAPHLSFDFFEFPLGTLSLTKTVLALVFIQLPLTVTNSIFSPAFLIPHYFPKKNVSASQLAWSVGLTNLITCPLGGMPACHGAGGLVAQYHFGARTGVSMIFLGAVKIMAALFLGDFFLDIAQYFPKSLLGLLFIFPALDLVRISLQFLKRREPAWLR